MFVTGDTRQCHRVQILDDAVCELPEQEFFFSRLTLNSGRQVIVVQPEEARIIIDDTADCPSKSQTPCSVIDVSEKVQVLGFVWRAEGLCLGKWCIV